MISRRFAVALSTLGLLIVAGCWSDDGLAQRYPVSGTVSYKGKPLEKGTITFVPESPDGRGASGDIENGAFKLTTNTPGDGAFAGKYTVTVVDVLVDKAKAEAATKKLAEKAKVQYSGAMMDPVRALLTPEHLSWGQLAHLHNDALQFAVSGGVPGLAAWALILAAPVAGYLQLPREARTPQRLHALLVLVIGAIVLGLPDTFLAAPMTLTIYVVLAAVIVGQPQRAAPPHPAAPGR